MGMGELAAVVKVAVALSDAPTFLAGLRLAAIVEIAISATIGAKFGAGGWEVLLFDWPICSRKAGPLRARKFQAGTESRCLSWHSMVDSFPGMVSRPGNRSEFEQRKQLFCVGR
jgi:hypothetical protein